MPSRRGQFLTVVEHLFDWVYYSFMGANRRYGDRHTALNDPAVQTPAEPGKRHVWVNMSTSKNHPAEYAGLIIAWRKGIHGWEAQVAHVTAIESPSLHITWVDARRLRPAT